MYIEVNHAKMEYQRRKRKKQLRRRIMTCGFLVFGFLLIHVFHNIGTESTGGFEPAEETGLVEKGLIELENIEEYPASLLELAERNPETEQFVLNYPNRTSTSQKMDISGEVEKGKIPLFLQWDERWGYETYGDDFMAVTGCGPTCLAMVYCGLTGKTDWNPYQIALKAEEEGYYVSGAGSSWDMMTGLAEDLGLTVSEVIFDEAHIYEALEARNPIICIMGPGDFTTSGHFIVLTGVDREGNVLVHDPNSQNRSQKSWELKKIMNQIRNLWAYSEN